MKKYYVYKITNNINGKWYIGKRCHKNPHKDSYMGSGKLINQAIKKYGKQNFIKEILAVFNTHEEAALLEATLVTKETISTHMSYNMHEGGMGGFAHLNDGSDAHRTRAIKASSLVKNRFDISSVGSKYRFTSGLSNIANEARKEDMKSNPEKYEAIYAKISLLQTENNSMKNRMWIFKEKENKVILKSEYDEYKKLGWISAKEREISRKNIMKERWVNNGVINKLIPSSSFESYIKDGFNPGRISSKKLNNTGL